MNQGFSSAAILLLNMRLIAFPGRKITRIQLIQLKGVDHVSKATSNKFIALRVLVFKLNFPTYRKSYFISAECFVFNHFNLYIRKGNLEIILPKTLLKN